MDTPPVLLLITLNRHPIRKSEQKSESAFQRADSLYELIQIEFFHVVQAKNHRSIAQSHANINA